MTVRLTTGRLSLRLALLALATAAVADAVDLEPYRERRLIRAEPPWWRRALALPKTGFDALGWPLRKGLVWAEDVNLPERVRDVFYFDDERKSGWFPNLDLGGEIGTAGGIRLFHDDLFGDGERGFVSGLVATSSVTSNQPGLEEWQVRSGFHDARLVGPFGVRLQVFAGEDEDEDLYLGQRRDGSFAFGGEAGDRDQVTYEIDQARGRFQLSLGPFAGATVGAAFRPWFAEVETGEGNEPPIPREVDGFGGPIVLLGGGPLFEWDGRDQKHRPRSGWYLYAEGGVWEGVEGRTTGGRDYRFYRYGGEIERYQRTFRADRTLAFRVALDRVEPVGDGAIPFWVLPELDEDHLLRAFRRHRFRDRGSLVANVEYRWPIWDTWDAFLFLDEGQVFHDYDDIEAGRFEWSTGIGARFYSAIGLLLRTHVAFGEHAREIRFGLEQDF